MTHAEYKSELGMLRGQLREANADLANTRTQLLQMQAIAHYLEDNYYKPMTRSLWRRVWFALRVKLTVQKQQPRKENE